MTAPRDQSYSDTLEQSLTDPAEAAAYIEAAIKQGDSAALLGAAARGQYPRHHGGNAPY